MMTHRADYFPNAKNSETQLLELPYKGGDLSLVLILPEKDFDLPRVEQSLTPEKLETWLSGLKLSHIRVVIPKFEITSDSIDLVSNLKSLGINDAFDKKESDFSIMVGKKYRNFLKPFIRSFICKAFISVNENGTEPVAQATDLWDFEEKNPPSFIVDQPFLFLIWDKKIKSILFMGRMADPALCQE
jgi:serpin B